MTAPKAEPIDSGLVHMMRELGRMDDAIDEINMVARSINDINKEKILRISVMFLKEAMTKRLADIAQMIKQPITISESAPPEIVEADGG